ncbi:MAG: mercury(II) reductase [Ginsengibacter sp.]
MSCCKVNSENQYNLVIVGGGSAAFAAAIKANDQGLKTLIINGGLPLGGTCVNVGCVPSKFLIRAAESVYKSTHSSFDGITFTGPSVDFQKIIKQKTKVVEDMQHRKYADLLKGLSHVSVVTGMAKFIGDRTIEVDGIQYEGLKVIIATGASTFIPKIEGLDSVPYLTSTTLFELEQLPRSLVILGAGYIALEIAQAYNRFGSKVTILQRSKNILSKQTKDISDELANHLVDDGIFILTETMINKIWKEGEEIKINYTHNDIQETLSSSHLLVAIGTTPNTINLQLDKVKVNTEHNGYIIVDEYLSTSNPDIFAVGDVTNLPAYVYTAAYEGGIAVQNAFNETKQRTDFNIVPWVVFTDPQVAGVGMDEKEAQEKGISFQVTTLSLSEIPRSIAALDTRGFIKLIRDTETDLLIGARVVAPEGGELIMEIGLAIKYKIPVKELAGMFHPYLTLSEGIKLAALSFTMDILKMSCCAS